MIQFFQIVGMGLIMSDWILIKRKGPGKIQNWKKNKELAPFVCPTTAEVQNPELGGGPPSLH